MASFTGLKMVRIAMIDPKTQELVSGKDGLSESGIYEVDDKDWGAKSANITGLTPNETEVWGNNKLQAIVKSGTTKAQVALEVNKFPMEVQQRLLNRIPDGNGGFKKDPLHKYNFALQVEFESPDEQTTGYFCCANGTISDGTGMNLQTDTDSPVIGGDQLTYKAYSAQAFDGDTYRFYSDAVDGFDEDKMNEATFGGYKKETAPKE